MNAAYITCVTPIITNTGDLIFDIFCLFDDSKTLKCIRVYNVELSFMLSRLPSYTFEETKSWIQEHIKVEFNDELQHVSIALRNDLTEGSYFTFGRNREYAEIKSTKPYLLNGIYKLLLTDLKNFYRNLNIDDLSAEDKLFINNTETPFKFTSTIETTKLENFCYVLSTRDNIPLIGGIKINKQNLNQNYPKCACSKYETFGVDWKNLSTTIVKDEHVDLRNLLTLVSYDIETYNKNSSFDSKDKNNYIFAIGIGVFDCVNPTPLKRYCIISKNFNVSNLNAKIHDNIITVSNEYSNNENDYTKYIIASNEQNLLKEFIKLLHTINPQLITGFNSFEFDDEYVYNRMKLHNMEKEYLQCFSYYDYTKLEHIKYKNEIWGRKILPRFRSDIKLKIDGYMQSNNKSIYSLNVLLFDTRKLLMKEDPKRFGKVGRSNLNSMLATYNIKNPYNGKELSKSGLSIIDMFNKWDSNIDIYSIALYCCQDAWIVGTLLITKNKLTDLIELAMISNTSLYDSLFRADGLRVSNTILGYAFRNNFAIMDTAYDGRNSEIKEPIGFKHFDKRTIVGGAVRNPQPGIQKFVTALDYSSMYPSNKEGSNIDSSSRVDEDIIKDPKKYGLKIVKKYKVNDMYGERNVFEIETL